MAMTVEFSEDVPATWPDAPDGLTPAAAALDAGPIWMRLEAWCGVRWSARPATALVEGSGTWKPPVAPFTVDAVSIWNGEDWQSYPQMMSPFGGLIFDREGAWRVTGTVGDDTVPAPPIQEAYRRLAEYLADNMPKVSGSSSVKLDVSTVSVEVQRQPTWLARAIHNSGAADLLRPYRRLA